MSVDKKFLLSKYGSIESNLEPPKKKKSKKSLKPKIIDEDGDDVWQNDIDDDLEGGLVTVEVTPIASKFKSKKESNWTKIQGESSDEEPNTEDQQYGLITGDQFAKQMKLKEKAIKKQMKKISKEDSGQHSETIYRDKYGKKVDMEVEKKKMEAVELARKFNEQNQKEFNRGLVQREKQQQKMMELMNQQSQSMTVYKDDKELNDQLKRQSRWDDPSAQYLQKSSKSKSKFPQYNGPPAPSNRFNIPPGYRWDGVDRSNGFEKDLIKHEYARKNLQSDAYAWGAEDM